MTFSEVRNEPDDFTQLGPVTVDSAITTNMPSRRGGMDFDSSSSPATASNSGGVSPILGTGSNSSPENQSEPGHKAGFNWWKRRRLSFSMTWRREPVIIRFSKFQKPNFNFYSNRNRFIFFCRERRRKVQQRHRRRRNQKSRRRSYRSSRTDGWRRI